MTRSRTAAVLAATAAAALSLGACGDDPGESKTSSTSEAYDPMKDPDRAEAIKTSEQTIRKGWDRTALSPYPKELFTEERIESKNEQIAAAKKAGQKSVGKDKVVSIETRSTSWERKAGTVGSNSQEVASNVCVERNGRWLDKNGKDIRGDQDGKPIKVGSRAEFVVRTVPGEGEQEGRWLVQSIKEQGPCTNAEG